MGTVMIMEELQPIDDLLEEGADELLIRVYAAINDEILKIPLSCIFHNSVWDATVIGIYKAVALQFWLGVQDAHNVWVEHWHEAGLLEVVGTDGFVLKGKDFDSVMLSVELGIYQDYFEFGVLDWLDYFEIVVYFGAGRASAELGELIGLVGAV